MMNQKCNQHLRRAHDLMQMQPSFGVGPIRHLRRKARLPGYESAPKTKQPLDFTIAQDQYWLKSMTLEERAKNRQVTEMQLYINCSEEAALKHISPRKLSNALYGVLIGTSLTQLLNAALEKKFRSWTWVDVEYAWQEDAPLRKQTTAQLEVEFSIAQGDRWSNYNTLHELRKVSDRYYPDPEELQLIHDTVQECFDSLSQSVPELSFLSPIQLTGVIDKTKYHSYASIQEGIDEDYHDLHRTVEKGDRRGGTKRRRFHKVYHM